MLTAASNDVHSRVRNQLSTLDHAYILPDESFLLKPPTTTPSGVQRYDASIIRVVFAMELVAMCRENICEVEVSVSRTYNV